MPMAGRKRHWRFTLNALSCHYESKSKRGVPPIRVGVAVAVRITDRIIREIDCGQDRREILESWNNWRLKMDIEGLKIGISGGSHGAQ